MDVNTTKSDKEREKKRAIFIEDGRRYGRRQRPWWTSGSFCDDDYGDAWLHASLARQKLNTHTSGLDVKKKEMIIKRIQVQNKCNGRQQSAQRCRLKEIFLSATHKSKGRINPFQIHFNWHEGLFYPNQINRKFSFSFCSTVCAQSFNNFARKRGHPLRPQWPHSIFVDRWFCDYYTYCFATFLAGEEKLYLVNERTTSQLKGM